MYPESSPPNDYEFMHWDEDEPITAIQQGTGRMVVWIGREWVQYTLKN